MKIPTYEEAEAAHRGDCATLLDHYVLNNEPAGRADETRFRTDLQTLIDYIQQQCQK